MKRMIVLLLCMMVAVPTVSVAAEQTRPSFRIVIDNKELILDNPPFLQAGTTMISVPSDLFSTRARGSWNAKAKQITANDGERKIV